jgi:hypothetical protein
MLGLSPLLEQAKPYPSHFSTRAVHPAGVISQDPVPRELDVFDWLTELQACALDAVLPIVPSEAVVIAASILAAKGELSIWLVALAAAAGGFLGRHRLLPAWSHRRRPRRLR